MGLFSTLASMQFINKYGKYALAFPLLYMDGSPNFYVSYPMVLFILCLIGGIIIMYFTSNPQVDANGNKVLDEKGKTIPDYSNPTPFQSFMRKVSYGLFGLSILFVLLYAVNYWFRYIPEYYKWLDKLPTEAKIQVGMMTALKNMQKSKH
jgi:cell division septal protein FtsQ